MSSCPELDLWMRHAADQMQASCEAAISQLEGVQLALVAFQAGERNEVAALSFNEGLGGEFAAELLRLPQEEGK